MTPLFLFLNIYSNMKRVIHITESQLETLVDNILNEQQTNFLELKGSSSNQLLITPKTLQDLGLKTNETNFKGRWILNTKNIYKTFTKVKNLSLFENLTPTSPQGKEDYLKIFVSRFTKTIYNKDKTVKEPSQFDRTTKTKIESIEGSGSKTFNIYYDDGTDKNYIWKISQVIGSGNGLIAFANALKKSSDRLPNKIEITISSEVSGKDTYQYDPAKVGNIVSILNSMSPVISASILNQPKMDIKNLDEVGSKFMNKSNEVISNSIVKLLYFLDKNFIPKEQQKSVEQLLTKYNPEPFTTLLNSLPKISNQSVQYIFEKNEKPLRRNLENEYKGVEKSFRDEVVKQYKSRILSFYKTKYKPDDAESMVNQIQFSTLPSLTIVDSILNAVFGSDYVQ